MGRVNLRAHVLRAYATVNLHHLILAFSAVREFSSCITQRSMAVAVRVEVTAGFDFLFVFAIDSGVWRYRRGQ